MSSQPEPSLFRRACAQWATGIAVVTVADSNGTPHGMTVNSFTSVSLEPPVVLICIDHRATLLPFLNLGTAIAINVLSEDQTELSSRFARKIEDRFENLDWTLGQFQSPLLSGTLAAFECAITESVTAGDHQVVIAAVRGVRFREGRPLLYFDSNYQSLA